MTCPNPLHQNVCGAAREHPQSLRGASGKPLDGHPSEGVDFLKNFGRSGRHGCLLNSLTKMEPFGRFRAGRRRGGVQGGGQENGNLNISLEVSQKLRFCGVFRPLERALPGAFTFLKTYAKSFFTHRHSARAISRGLKRVPKHIWTHKQSV